MIKNVIAFFVIAVFAIKSFSQEEVLELPIRYNSTFFDNKESLAISNKETGELVLFIEDDQRTKAILLNNKFEVVSEIETKSLLRTFKSFIGYQINANDNYTIYFTNNSKKKYGTLNLDFKAKKSKMSTLNFKLKDKREVHVEGISFNGVFYLMSVTKRESDVHFYTFNEEGVIKDKKTVSFAFLNTRINDYSKKAYHFLVTKSMGSSGSLVKMDTNTPNAIEITSKPNKLYFIDDQFVFTFDNNKWETEIAKISTKTFEIDIEEFKQPTINKFDFVNHNSYIYDDKVFQIKSSSNSMKFTVKDFMSKDLLKEITLNREDSITFKNTPIIQEGPAFIAGRRTREMEKTSKFLRKISSGDIGVSVYKQKGNYKIVLGSKVEINRGGAGGFGPMGGFGGVPLGAIGGLSASFNPTFFAYGGYSSTKSTHIDCLFNNKFEHVNGEVSKNVFDKIKDYEDFLTKGRINTPELKNLFRHNDKLYFGYVGSRDKKYHLVEFND